MALRRRARPDGPRLAMSSTSSGTAPTAAETKVSSTTSIAAGVDARRPAGGVPVPLGEPFDRRRRGRHRGGDRAVVQRAGRIRGRPRRATSTAAAPAGRPSACPGSSRDRPRKARCRRCALRPNCRRASARPPSECAGACCGRASKRPPRRSTRPRATSTKRGRGGEGVHRRDRPVRVLAVRQPDDLHVRGAAAADRRRARGVRDGDRNGRGVHLARCAAGRG